MKTNYKKSQCTVEKTLKIIGKKWTILIIHHLCDGTKRFGELQKLMNGISPRTLSLRLRTLEKSGIIKKKIFPEIPLHVEYSLTNKGLSLRSIIDSMQKWGETSIQFK